MLTDLLPLLRPISRTTRRLADAACALDSFVCRWCALFGIPT